MDDVYVQLPLCQRLMSCRCAPVVLELNLKLGLLDVSATLLLTTPYVRCPQTPGSEDDIKHFILVQSALTSPSPHPSHPAHSMCAQSVCWKSLPPGEGARALSGWARKHTHTQIIMPACPAKLETNAIMRTARQIMAPYARPPVRLRPRRAIVHEGALIF